MTIRSLALIAALIATSAAPATASPADQVTQAATASFARMPAVQVVASISGTCGADQHVNSRAVYCTSRDAILITQAEANSARAPYLLAHLFAHGAQVQHGVADVALRTITARRDEEPALRAMVAGQVDCVAGVLYERAGLPLDDLTQLFNSDPFPDPHWGRSPLSSAPVMGIGLSARNQWFARGYSGGLSSCGSGEFGPDLLIKADRF